MSQSDHHEVVREDMERFAAGRATAAERRLVLRHLLAGCRHCQGFLRSPAVPDNAYEVAFARAEAKVLTGMVRQSARRLLGELESIAAVRRELLIRNAPRYACAALAELLAERSLADAGSDSRTAWLDARAAVAAAEGACALNGGDQATRDALALAWSALGNAHRLRGETAPAEAAFRSALAALDRGSGRPAPRAWYCRLLSSFRLMQDDFAAARALALEAASIYRGLGNGSGEAAAHILLAIVAIRAGDPGAALAPLDRSLELAKQCGDENLWRLATGNLVRCYLDLGRLHEAHAVFLAAGMLFDLDDEEGVVGLKWRWTGALIERDLGLLAAAAANLLEVREGLLERGLRVEIAHVSLDLIGVYLRMGDAAGVLRTVGETIPIYRAVGAPCELLATLIELTQIAHQRENALTVLAAVSEQMRALLPDYRSEPPAC